jgi:hypothetical protein
MIPRSSVCVLFAFAACAHSYAYTFQAPAVADADLDAQILVDANADAVHVELTNKTDQVLQIEWADIVIHAPDGRTTGLRPDIDLGWIDPGATVTATLFPLAVPRRGDAAAANEGRRFRLDVPAIVRRESKVYSFTLTAHVREL